MFSIIVIELVDCRVVVVVDVAVALSFVNVLKADYHNFNVFITL